MRCARALAVLLLCSPAAAQEAGSAKVVPIQVTGDPATRFSLVIMGDGYTAAEQPAFREHVEKHLNILWSLEPFRSYRNYINVYAVEIISAESGVTCDPAHRQPRKTPLSLQFSGGCQNPNARGVVFDRATQEQARTYARMATPAYDQILAIANTDTYGGIGGREATTTGANALSPYITPHEIGHSLGRLQDEYTYRERGIKGGIFMEAEPSSIHHTLLTAEQMKAQQRKWYRWLGEPSESGGIIGVYEGGLYSVGGVWRPSKHSMMISLGYYFDQVSLERLTERISKQVELISSSTPTTAPVQPNSVIWIETAHPVYHELNVRWEVDGRPLANMNDRRALPLRSLNLSAGAHRVTARVVDPTPFVRDPLIRDTSFSATRSWTVENGSAPTTAAAPARVAFAQSTLTDRAVGGRAVIYVETTAPAEPNEKVTWRLDGRELPNPTNSRSLQLARVNLRAGTHRVSATVAEHTLTWTVDNTGPKVAYTLDQPVAAVTRANGSRHYYIRDQFTMKLDPSDDQPGYVVGEFRLNGDGWHHYYGWPDAPPGTPFRFTARGTNIKELVYGSLSSEGLSPQPWETRTPGWGTHRIEYRARDAAGNIGAVSEFAVTIAPSIPCTSTITGTNAQPIRVTSGFTCLERATVGAVTVEAGGTLIASNSRINGALNAAGAAGIELIGTTVQGTTRITETTGVLTLFGSSFSRAVMLGQNRGSTTVAGNTISGTLSCTGNATVTTIGLANRGGGTQCPAR